MELKKKESEIYAYICDFMVKNGYTPSIREICEHFRFKSVSSAHCYFMRLVEKGYITQVDKHSSRYVVKDMKYVRV